MVAFSHGTEGLVPVLSDFIRKRPVLVEMCDGTEGRIPQVEGGREREGEREGVREREREGGREDRERERCIYMVGTCL